jgi:diguanylate cyclase (GGDEF)-like protein/PAS domain S-box-containing protein
MPNTAAGTAVQQAAPSADVRAGVFADQVRQLYRLSRAAYPGTLVNALLVVAALWGSVAHGNLFWWTMLVCGVTGARYLLYLNYNRAQPPASEAGTWRNRFVIGTCAMGCLWGALGSWLLPPDDTLLQFIIIFLIGGMIAGAVIVLTPVRMAFFAFTLPAILPLTLAILTQGSTLHLQMGILMLTYLAVMVGTHNVMHQTHVDTLRIRFENAQLVAQLFAANREAERANAELSRQVASQQQTELALRESTARLEAVLDGSPLAIVVQDRHGNVRRWTRAAQDLFGWTEDEVLGKRPPFIPPDRQAQSAEFRAMALQGERLLNRETVRVRKNGKRVDVSVSASVIRDGTREVIGLVFMFADITDRQRAAKREQLEHAVTRALAEGEEVTQTMTAVVRAVCKITDWVYGARWLRDVEDGRLRCYEIWHVDDPHLAAFADDARTLRRQPDLSSGMVRTAYLDGEPVWVENMADLTQQGRRVLAGEAGLASAFAFPIVVSGEVRGFMEFFARDPRSPDRELLAIARAIGSQVGQFLGRKEAETHLEFYATHDALTGLPNRSFFSERLRQALAQATRHRRRVAVLFIDLDGFKVVNDTLGHDAGDHLLREIGGRLRDSLREGDTVGRQGGDEFVVLIEDASSDEAVEDVARKILETVAQPAVLAGRAHALTASIGISVFPEHGLDAQTLLRNADTAMYRSKEEGRNTYRFYVPPATGA